MESASTRTSSATPAAANGDRLPRGSRSRRAVLGVGVFVGFLVVSLITYRGLWNNLFFTDDYHWLVVAEDFAASPSSLLQGDDLNPEVAIRLTQRVVMGITWTFFGASPAAHHVASIVLHALASTLVFFFLATLHAGTGGPPSNRNLGHAAVGGLFFATSHDHAMAVLWLAAQSGILATSSILLLAIHFLRRQHRLSELSTVLGAVALLLLALYSKNTVAAFPLVLAAAAAIRPGGSPDEASRGRWLRLSLLLAAIGAAHVAFTRLILLGDRTGSALERFSLSTQVFENLAGALLAPFVSASAYAAGIGDAIPYPLASVALTLALLLIGRWLGVGRAVAWGLVWIVLMALPVSFMNFEQYHSDHLTITRYYYASMVGAVIVVSFLVRGLVERSRRPRLVFAVVAALLGAHVAHHGERIQDRIAQLQRWGAGDRAAIDVTLARARAEMPHGAVVYAVGWPLQDAYVRCVGELYFEPEGFTLRAQDELEAGIAAYERDELTQAWVALFEPRVRRFVVVPFATYLTQHHRP